MYLVSKVNRLRFLQLLHRNDLRDIFMAYVSKRRWDRLLRRNCQLDKEDMCSVSRWANKFQLDKVVLHQLQLSRISLLYIRLIQGCALLILLRRRSQHCICLCISNLKDQWCHHNSLHRNLSMLHSIKIFQHYCIFQLGT